MNYQIKLDKEVSKFLKVCDKHIAQAFYEKVLIIAADPITAKSKLDITIMIGYKDVYRLRIGVYRFLYYVNNQKLIIFFADAGSRGNIYKKI